MTRLQVLMTFSTNVVGSVTHFLTFADNDPQQDDAGINFLTLHQRCSKIASQEQAWWG